MNFLYFAPTCGCRLIGQDGGLWTHQCEFNSRRPNHNRAQEEGVISPLQLGMPCGKCLCVRFFNAGRVFLHQRSFYELKLFRPRRLTRIRTTRFQRVNGGSNPPAAAMSLYERGWGFIKRVNFRHLACFSARSSEFTPLERTQQNCTYYNLAVGP